ncbi:MAG: monomethylamine:corrinoid methyltransferase [Candidatus Bathyarchaeota archaeon]|nr:MAG: monomethylamine:corrinoid methyltransferase [Candidatus Bathyarchaeota archaeon]
MNTNMIVAGVIGSICAEPCTEDYLYELMYKTLIHLPSGSSFIMATRPFTPRRLNLTTPLEVKWAYECVKAVLKMNRKKANSMAKKVLKKFEDELENPLPGKSLTECYDVRARKPNQEYLDLYYKVISDLEDMGFEFKS